MKELTIALEAASAGGEIITRYFNQGVAIRGKAAGDGTAQTYNLVSDADVQSEQAIAAVISKAYPAHAILGEEALSSTDPKSDDLWIIDPLDGTTNFAHQIPHFAVSIAYQRRGELVCGVIFNPIRDEWFTATRGGGAMHNQERASVSSSTQLDQALIGVGFYYDRGAMMRATLSAIEELFGHHIHGIRRFGTASLDLVQVGIGSLAGFFEYQLSPWDFAAGKLFVEEAGGKVTDCSGNVLPLRSTGVLASNTHLHASLCDITQRHVIDEQV